MTSYAPVGGLNLAYEDTGGDGFAVLFAHGFLMDRTMFRHQAAALQGAYRCIAWDTRGFGDTGLVTEPFTYWDSADDAIGLLDHLGIDRAVIVGMSQGGFLGLRAALRHPERVAGLVLVDSQAGAEDEGHVAAYQQLVDGWAGDGDVDEIAATVASIILGEPSLHDEWIAKWKAMPREQIRIPGHALLTRESIEDRLGEVTCPVLGVHGEEDGAIPPDRARAQYAALPDLRGFVTVPGAAHAANLTHPDDVNPPLRAFLDEVAAGAGR